MLGKSEVGRDEKYNVVGKNKILTDVQSQYTSLGILE
jgi:hypothetical protein